MSMIARSISMPSLQIANTTRIIALLLFACCASLNASSDRVEWKGIVFHTYTAKPDKIDLYWKDADGNKFRQFSTLQKYLRARYEHIAFLMNGGLFEEDGEPCGLLIIDGVTLHPINMKTGTGNFYLKPNGIFYIDATGAHIVSSSEFEAKFPSPRLAIQSGPLLLRNNLVHPAFSKISTHDLHRNGVGLRKDGTVVFAITEFDQPKRVTLYQFAEFFRSQGCNNALFLDGDLSQMLVDVKGDITPGNNFGTIFAITEPEKQTSREGAKD